MSLILLAVAPVKVPATVTRIGVIAIAVLVVVVVVELVRRRRMMERYALLWLAAAATRLDRLRGPQRLRRDRDGGQSRRSTLRGGQGRTYLRRQ